MAIVDVHEAEAQFSRLIERVEAGEEITIARDGRPVARLVPVASERRRPGSGKGRIEIPDDFDAPLPDALLDAFEGGGVDGE